MVVLYYLGDRACMSSGGTACCENNQAEACGCSKVRFCLAPRCFGHSVYITYQVNDCDTLPACVASVSKSFKVRELVVFLAV